MLIKKKSDRIMGAFVTHTPHTQLTAGPWPEQFRRKRRKAQPQCNHPLSPLPPSATIKLTEPMIKLSRRSLLFNLPRLSKNGGAQNRKQKRRKIHSILH